MIMFNNYSLLENLKNIYAFLITKIFWKKARLIRRPIYARNKRNILYGRNFTTGYNLRIAANKHNKSIFIGENVIIGDYCHIEGYKNLVIGDNVLIASRVYISDTSHGTYKEDAHVSPYIPPNNRKLFSSSVVIKDNVWIGENVCVLPGVTIGKGCVVGANSVVTKNIPDYSIVVGVPARVIKYYDQKRKQWVNTRSGEV